MLSTLDIKDCSFSFWVPWVLPLFIFSFKCALDLGKLGLVISLDSGKISNSGVRAGFESLQRNLIIV